MRFAPEKEMESNSFFCSFLGEDIAIDWFISEWPSQSIACYYTDDVMAGWDVSQLASAHRKQQ